MRTPRETALLWVIIRFIALSVTPFRSPVAHILVLAILEHLAFRHQHFRAKVIFLFLLLSRSVVFSSLWPHGLQHARPPCPSPTPKAHSNSCPQSRWCHPAIPSSAGPFSSCCQSFPASDFFSSESALHTRWPKDWSFSFSIGPSNEYSGLISFRIDWFDLLVVRGTL